MNLFLKTWSMPHFLLRLIYYPSVKQYFLYQSFYQVCQFYYYLYVFLLYQSNIENTSRFWNKSESEYQIHCRIVMTTTNSKLLKSLQLHLTTSLCRKTINNISLLWLYKTVLVVKIVRTTTTFTPPLLFVKLKA